MESETPQKGRHAASFVVGAKHLQGLQEILWLGFAGDVLAVTVAYWSLLGGFAWKLGAFEA